MQTTIDVTWLIFTIILIPLVVSITANIFTPRLIGWRDAWVTRQFSRRQHSDASNLLLIRTLLDNPVRRETWVARLTMHNQIIVGANLALFIAVFAALITSDGFFNLPYREIIGFALAVFWMLNVSITHYFFTIDLDRLDRFEDFERAYLTKYSSYPVGYVPKVTPPPAISADPPG